MKKGQRAMVAAQIRALYKNYTSTRQLADQLGRAISHGYLNQAAIVLEYAPDLAAAVEC
jgi:hypothetical protein